jgi:ribosomally synthesized peptide (two-chain TOMM family)
MYFRTSYLRSIAQAWADEEFKRKLLEDPIAAMRERLGFHWPWSRTHELRLRDGAGKYEWIDDEWVWSPRLGCETLTIFVPLDPDIAPGYRAMAIADYYRQRPSLFEDTPSSVPDLPPSDGSEIGLHGPSPAGGYLPGGEFANFKVVLIEAMALAWVEPAFRKRLEVDAAAALRSLQHYQISWNLGVVIKNDLSARWDPPQQDRPSGWHLPTKDIITLNLPAKPSAVQSEPVALAAYNAAGAAYPFTCCASECA